MRHGKQALACSVYGNYGSRDAKIPSCYIADCLCNVDIEKLLLDNTLFSKPVNLRVRITKRIKRRTCLDMVVRFISAALWLVKYHPGLSERVYLVLGVGLGVRGEWLWAGSVIRLFRVDTGRMDIETIYVDCSGGF